MKITIYAIGKTATEFYEPAIAEYQKRLTRYQIVAWHVLPSSNKETESASLLQRIPQGAYVILLDERGEQFTTPAFAQKLEQLQNQSFKEIVFIIGGAHGATSDVMERAQLTLSLSKLVFPHEQVRLMLIEQIYRAYDYNAGGKYHHA